MHERKREAKSPLDEDFDAPTTSKISRLSATYKTTQNGECLLGDIKSTFVGYFLHNRTSKLRFSYLHSDDETFYLVGATDVAKVQRIFVSFNLLYLK